MVGLTQLRVYDYNLFTFLQYYNDDEALYYIDGVAVHFYQDNLNPDTVFSLAQTNKKDTFILMTEASQGSFIYINLKEQLRSHIIILGLTPEESVKLGSWDRGATYIESIIRVSI